ncbi:adenylate/guanylate cyclase domain-containing protein [Spirosoma terrae]|uniref:Response regulator n=1 Tax=Spirosoma terrae TaxID=1968276 RepID=A0A6L9LD60_9BACT|nr:adenylate/guanylate cyclase domain-containing response regulator [Spirosoma terrae]NDU96408.1 response regulator [Spirosoma terrae]
MSTKILVVDDEADLELLIKQKFRRKIREGVYEFMFAGNGKEALTKIDENPDIEIVLCDINMPIMDGLTLLAKIPEHNTILKAVVVSAYGDMNNIRTAMNRGAFDFVMKPVDFSDLEITIEKTIRQVEQVRETIQAIQENNILKMYVDETVINFMARPEFENTLMASETVEATVVFFDICGFTAISEKMPAVQVVNLLNTYFDQMVKEIIAQGGYVDKFMGDAVMAVFRGSHHIDRAIDAALAVRQQIQTNQQEESEGVLFQPSVSTGINTGEMVSGNIGSISLKRLDYTVIGDTVNVAQRLQAIAKPNQIVISEQTYERIKESFQCERVGDVNLKNKSNAVTIYEVLA